MPATYDTTAAPVQFSNLLSAGWSHVASGSDRHVRVLFGVAAGTIPAVTAITYGGAAMTLVGTHAHVNGVSRASMYSKVNPAASSQAISITWDVASYGAGSSISFNDVLQSSPDGTAVTNFVDAGPSVSATVVDFDSDSLINDIIKDYQGPLNVGADQTQRFSEDDGSFGEQASSSTQPASAGGVMSWSFPSGNGAIAIVASAVKGNPAIPAATYKKHFPRKHGFGKVAGRRVGKI